MDHIHDRHRAQHQHRIEDVDVDLMAHDRASIALHVLDHTHERADEDEHADDVQADHVLGPRPLLRELRRHLEHAEVEEGGGDDEEAKGDDLEDETDDDDCVAEVGVAAAAGKDGGAGSLDDEGNAIAGHEDLLRLLLARHVFAGTYC